MVAYHDDEWGVPTRDERELFELLTLEGAQAGLSWSTILRRREGYRRAFAGFDPDAVAAYGEAEVTVLLADAGIIRNGQKIRSAITNAALVVELRQEGGFCDLLWSYVEGKPIVNHRPTSRRSRHRRRSRRRSAATCADAASRSSARRSCTRCSSRRGWSTTTSRAAFAERVRQA